MITATEQIQVLYEIALSIGEGKDLAGSTETSLSAFLRKLNCSAGAVFQYKEEDSGQLKTICSIPRSIEKRKLYKNIVINLTDASGCAKDILKKERRPFKIMTEGDMNAYIMELPEFGLLLIIKKGSKLPEDLLWSLQPLSKKMALSCKSFLNKKALVASENRFKLLADSTFEAIFFTENGFCTNQNKRAEQLFGYSINEIINRPLLELIHPDYHKKINEHQKNSINAIFEALAVRKDGSTFICEIQGSTVESDGKYIRIEVLRDLTLRKKAELALKQSEKRFKEIADLLPQPIWEADLNGKFIYTNKSGYETMGYSEMDIEKGVFVHELIVEEERPRLLKNFKERLQGLQDNYIEYNCIRKNGTKFPALIYSSVIERDKKIVGLRGITIDITKQKETEIKLQQYNERLELAMLGSNAGLWDWNILTGEVYFSERWCSMLGYLEGDIKPYITSWENLVHPEDLKPVKEILNKHLNNLSPIYQSEHRMKTKDGGWKWILDTGKVISFDPNGNPSRAVGTHIDITDKKEQEFSLRQNVTQQELLSDIAIDINLLENFDVRMENILSRIGTHTGVSRVYIFENDYDENTTSNTYEWCNTGIEPQKDELTGIPYEIIPSWRKILEEQGRVYSENIFELPEDIVAILEPQLIKSLVVYPLYVQGVFHGFIGFDECSRNKHWNKSELELLRTISGIIANAFERKQMEQSILDERDKANLANKSKSEFLANMSHEIRTPMNAILGFSEALYHKLDNKEQKHMVKSVLSSGNMLLTLLNDILDLSKIEAGKLELSTQPVDILSIVNEIQLLFKEKASRKGIELNVSASPSFPMVLKLDEIRIKQVLFNLVGNAIKFTHRGYVNINIDLKKSTGGKCELIIKVEDTGIGIQDAQMELIFEAFKQQADQSTKLYEGVGLGLAISRKLVEKMNGTISVNSRIEKGSTFTVTIPTIQLNDSVYKGNSNLIDYKHIEFEKATVMVVDDVISNIEMVESFLSRTNLMVSAAENGEIALQILKHSLPDIILLDMRMPGIDGYEVARRIKANTKIKHIPIIAFTASVFSSEKIETSGLFEGFLYKPVSRKQLFSELTKFLPCKIFVDDDQEDKDSKTETFDSLVNGLAIPLQEISIKLKTHFLPKWEKINKQLVLFEIEKFVKELHDYGTTASALFITEYSKKIIEGLENIDLELIKKEMALFPVLIQKVEHHLKH